MDVEEDLDDPTIRDDMENGVVFTRPRYTRIRRDRKYNYENCVALDRLAILNFYSQVGGWSVFTYTDRRIPNMAPEVMSVRFKNPPKIKDAGWVGGQKRFNISIEIEEV